MKGEWKGAKEIVHIFGFRLNEENEGKNQRKCRGLYSGDWRKGIHSQEEVF